MMRIHSFLGLAGYYCQFIANVSRIAAPLTRLTRKDVRFEWDDSCELAFRELKKRLTSAPVLNVLNSQQPYVVYTNGSGTSLGCVIMKMVK